MKLYRSFMLTAALIGLLTTTALAQTRIVTGIVKDPSGAPVPGVNVLIKGTSNGSSTDGDGKYSISVAEGGNPVLVFSFIGYASQETELGTRSVVDVVLTEDVTQLNEVVVTALGVEKDSKSLGYAVTKVDGGALTQARETNVINSLEGRVAGVNISGTPGGAGSSSSIVIRGLASVNGQPPLFVINGVPMDNSTRGSA
ncbi:MAG TPA: carboxypeptidase-like regulatory domain-containing protein, partial [Cyclobacteriaceae bacterium]|nr:carboxypeptidase-like regulatory domain-containing protein [Cyclobacteriaceae bacterium]